MKKYSRITANLLTATALILSTGALRAADPPQKYVDLGPDGKLVYDTDTRGNRIPDFSYAGYGGGGVPIPDVPARVLVAPANGDDGARIQAALDYVSRLPANSQGIRGAVLMVRGRFEVAGSLVIRTSGVVLRGQGVGENSTVLVATGNSRRTLIELSGASDRRTIGPVRNVTGDYVPVNANLLELDSTEGLKIGESVLVERPSPKNWIQFMGFGDVPGRPAPSWKAGAIDVRWERQVVAVDGNRVTLDVPFTCALEKEFGGGQVTAYEWPGRLRQVGVENLRCESEWDKANPKDEEHSWMAVTLENVEDAWVRNVTATHFVSSAVNVLESCRRVTVEDCASLAPVSELAGYRRHSFYTNGGQTLFLRCRAEEGRHDFAIGWLAPGPNAFVDCSAREAYDFSGPIESWATGVLLDNVHMDGGGLRFENRELWDNGVGWAAANSVLWQCTAPVIIARTPPGAQNWAIGTWAQFVGDAKWRAPNEFVKPDSLYVQQLTERVGSTASVAVNARPISASAEGAITIETVLRQNPQLAAKPVAPPLKKLAVTNGWLTVDGKLLVGDQLDITWWRGNANPERAPEFGHSVTRFVPGRKGPGLTDDLDALTDDMVKNGHAGLRHHWGLWYDRRRDDHEMIRRMSADVWPPFYEQAWARTGIGRSWNGLSLYDLTKFNPWYFGRLHQFAEQSSRKGLLFVNSMYFQHNIIESGAHWVDFPWRPVNNINHTGFTEPPPFTGDTIHMANEFYDIKNPVLVPLHRLFIRHSLDNLADQPNVLHVSGEEFTGSTHFMQFWVDAIAQWRKETKKQALIGLSAPKDVQDAILADPKRSPQIDAVDFKYWWQTDKGLFAPPGGHSMSPRQEERKFSGGRPNDLNLARMAAEYRGRYPAKAVLCDFASAGWAFVCAGGSVPNLPGTTDTRLLATVPRMQPWKAATTNQQWTLREPGRSYLIHSATGAEVELDLSGETGRFIVNKVNLATGVVPSGGKRVTAGHVVVLSNPTGGPAMFWLERE
jgi:hypothetical protein